MFPCRRQVFYSEVLALLQNVLLLRLWNQQHHCPCCPPPPPPFSAPLEVSQALSNSRLRPAMLVCFGLLYIHVGPACAWPQYSLAPCR